MGNSVYDMNLGNLSYGRSAGDDWSCCESFCYLYDFNETVLSFLEESVKPGWKSRNNRAVLTNRRLLDIPVIFVDGE